MWIDGLKVIERFFNLPLDYSNENGEKIRVFARHIIPKSEAKTLEDEAKLPYRKPCDLSRSAPNLKLEVSFFFPLYKSCTCKVCIYPKTSASLWFFADNGFKGGPGFEINAPYTLSYMGKVVEVLDSFNDTFSFTTIARFMNRDIRCDDFVIAFWFLCCH